LQRVRNLRDLRQLSRTVTLAPADLPVLFAALHLSEAPDAVPEYLRTFPQTAMRDLRALPTPGTVQPAHVLTAWFRAHGEKLLAAELLAGCTVLLVTHDPLEALRLGEHILVMNGRPATITERFAIDLPRPRAPELSATAVFQATVATVRAAIRVRDEARTGLGPDID